LIGSALTPDFGPNSGLGLLIPKGDFLEDLQKDIWKLSTHWVKTGFKEEFMRRNPQEMDTTDFPKTEEKIYGKGVSEGVFGFLTLSWLNVRR